MGLQATHKNKCASCGNEFTGTECTSCGKPLDTDGPLAGQTSTTARSGERLRAPDADPPARSVGAFGLLLPVLLTRGNMAQSIAALVATAGLLIWLPLYASFWTIESRALVAAVALPALWVVVAVVQRRQEQKLLEDLGFDMPGYLQALVHPRSDRYERYVSATVEFAHEWPPMSAAVILARKLTVVSPQKIDGEHVRLRLSTVTLEGRWRFELATTGRHRDLMLAFVLDQLRPLHERYPIRAVRWAPGKGLS